MFNNFSSGVLILFDGLSNFENGLVYKIIINLLGKCEKSLVIVNSCGKLYLFSFRREKNEC